MSLSEPQFCLCQGPFSSFTSNLKSEKRQYLRALLIAYYSLCVRMLVCVCACVRETERMKQLPLNLKDEVEFNVYCNPQILFGIRDVFFYLVLFFYICLLVPLGLLKHFTQKKHKSI